MSVVGLLGAAGLAVTASADTLLQMDINSLTATIDDAVGADTNGNGVLGSGEILSYTGSISVSDDATSSLVQMFVDGISRGISEGQLADFAMTINLVNGMVSGGTLLVMDTANNTYEAEIVSDSGSIGTAAGNAGPFTIDGLTFNGFFSSDVFAGADVSPWNNDEPLGGSFLQFTFGPETHMNNPNFGVDPDADIDVFIQAQAIPLPTPVAMAGLGLLGISLGTRRRG